MIKAYLILWTQITASKSVRPKTHVLDNEASEAFKKESERIAKYNRYLWITTDKTWLREQSKHLRIIARQSLQK
jgi:hypothetical protein